jgi:hypothetical protein
VRGLCGLALHAQHAAERATGVTAAAGGTTRRPVRARPLPTPCCAHHCTTAPSVAPGSPPNVLRPATGGTSPACSAPKRRRASGPAAWMFDLANRFLGPPLGPPPRPPPPPAPPLVPHPAPPPPGPPPRHGTRTPRGVAIGVGVGGGVPRGWGEGRRAAHPRGPCRRWPTSPGAPGRRQTSASTLSRRLPPAAGPARGGPPGGPACSPRPLRGLATRRKLSAASAPPRRWGRVPRSACERKRCVRAWFAWGGCECLLAKTAMDLLELPRGSFARVPAVCLPGCGRPRAPVVAEPRARHASSLRTSNCLGICVRYTAAPGTRNRGLSLGRRYRGGATAAYPRPGRSGLRLLRPSTPVTRPSNSPLRARQTAGAGRPRRCLQRLPMVE